MSPCFTNQLITVRESLSNMFFAASFSRKTTKRKRGFRSAGLFLSLGLQPLPAISPTLCRELMLEGDVCSKPQSNDQSTRIESCTCVLLFAFSRHRVSTLATIRSSDAEELGEVLIEHPKLPPCSCPTCFHGGHSQYTNLCRNHTKNHPLLVNRGR